MFKIFFDWLFGKHDPSLGIGLGTCNFIDYVNEVPYNTDIHIYPLCLDTHNYVFVHNEIAYSIDLSMIKWEKFSIYDHIHIVGIARGLAINPNKFENCKLKNFDVDKILCNVPTNKIWSGTNLTIKGNFTYDASSYCPNFNSDCLFDGLYR